MKLRDKLFIAGFLSLAIVVFIAFGFLPIESLLAAPLMFGATTYTFPDTGRNWQDNARPFFMTRTVVIPATAGAADIWQALSIPVGTLVTSVKCIIVSAGAGGDFTIDIGDGSADNGWDDAIDATAAANTVTASLEATDAYGKGKYYAAADTIDVKVATATITTGATVKIVAECIDMLNNLGGSTVSS